MTESPSDGVRPVDWMRALAGADVMANKAVPPTAIALFRFAPGVPKKRGGWVFFASGQTLAAEGRVSVSTIERGVSALIRAGHLERVKRGGGINAKANEYRLTRPEPTPLTREGSSDPEAA